MKHSNSANGDICPLVREHGHMYVLPSGRQYCPHQTHDRNRTIAMYENDGKTPVRRSA